MVLLLRKLYLYFTKDPEGVRYSTWVGGSNFFQGGGGVQMLHIVISLETHIRTCYFPGGGGGVRTPYPPLDPHHNGTIFITVPLLTIILRH